MLKTLVIIVQSVVAQLQWSRLGGGAVSQSVSLSEAVSLLIRW